MSTSKFTNEEQASKVYAIVNRSIRSLDVASMQQQMSVLPETAAGRMQRLVTIYSAVKPLLSVITTLPLIPQAWRAALALFTSALDAVVATTSVPEIVAASTDSPSPVTTPDFKSGKDL